MLKIHAKPTGWFQIGWSAEIPSGAVKPLKYFGQDLVAFRTEDGELTVLNAHCKHLGAHLGYGGAKVKKDCIVCPYHGWEWDKTGLNTRIPYQDEPTRARLRRWDIVEKHGLVMMWHDPAGGGPRDGWDIPDLFAGFSDHPELAGQSASEDDFYPCYPEAAIDRPGETVPIQVMQENSADSMHFRFTHSAPEDPELLWFETDGIYWRSVMGFKSPRTKQVAMKLYSKSPYMGFTHAVFDGPRKFQKYRLILCATPVDDDHSDLRVSYFIPKDPASPDRMPKDVLDFCNETERLFEEDCAIWRHQMYVQKPVLAQQDIVGYSALRQWSQQFYEDLPKGVKSRQIRELEED